jgi:hypothetical protein
MGGRDLRRRWEGNLYILVRFLHGIFLAYHTPASARRLTPFTLLRLQTIHRAPRLHSH